MGVNAGVDKIEVHCRGPHLDSTSSRKEFRGETLEFVSRFTIVSTKLQWRF